MNPGNGMISALKEVVMVSHCDLENKDGRSASYLTLSRVN